MLRPCTLTMSRPRGSIVIAPAGAREIVEGWPCRAQYRTNAICTDTGAYAAMGNAGPVSVVSMLEKREVLPLISRRSGV